jgi:membrane-bound ClpP family serine protease
VVKENGSCPRNWQDFEKSGCCGKITPMTPKPKNAYLIFLDDSDNRIDDVTASDVEKKIGDNEAEHLFLVLESRGGSPFSAVAIMNILNSRFTRISTIVPSYAKSAATLMALGTDEIYMGDKSALGPLDLPIERHRDGSRISALDVQNTTPTMAALVESIAKTRYEFLRKRELSTLKASELSLGSATDFLSPS